MMRPYLIRLGDWLSAGFNVLVLNGSTDESTSGRAYREAVINDKRHWLMLLQAIDALFALYEQEHCRKAYLADLERCRARLADAPAALQ